MTNPSTSLEFDEIVKFNEETESLEKFEHNEKVESVKKSVIKLVGKKDDDVSLEGKARQKAMDHIRDVEQFSISGGEHSQWSNRQLAQNRVYRKIENVSFQMFQETIGKITELSTVHLEDSLTTAEIQLDIGDMESAKIENCNNRREQRMREIVEEEENTALDGESASTSKSSKKEKRTHIKKRLGRINGIWRKRETEDGEPPRKYGKIDDVEKNSRETHSSERKAKEVMIEVRKEAMEAIFIDEIHRVRLLAGVQELLKRMPPASHNGRIEKWEDEVTKFAVELGGRGNIDEDLNMLFVRLEDSRQPAEETTKQLDEEWLANQNQHQGIIDVLEKIIKIFQETRFKEPLFDHVGKCEIYDIIREMSFWPIFEDPKKHYADGGYRQESSVGSISRHYKKATSPQGLQIICDFFKNVEILRIELMNRFAFLIAYFKNVLISDPRFFSDVVLKGLNCAHDIWSTTTMSIDEETRKAEKAKLKGCHICVVLHTLAHLRFAIGNGDFYGKVKEDPTSQKSIESFLKRVLKFAKIKTKIDGSMEMRQIRDYLERLRQSTIRIQSSVQLFIVYANQIVKWCISRKNDVESLRFRTGNQDLTDQKDCLEFCEGRMEVNDKELKDALGSLACMINLYEEDLKKEKEGNEEGEQNEENEEGQQNEENEEGQQNKEDDKSNECAMCFEKMVVVANFSCAHRMCAKCYQKDFKSKDICPVCMVKIEHEKIKYAVKNSDVPETKLTIKVKRTIELMEKIIGDDADNKIVLFTSAAYRKPTWNCLVRALQKTEMPFVEVKPDVSNRQASTWKFEEDCRILLCSPTTCSDKFNAPRTTHIIFLDQSSLFLKVGKAMYEKAIQQKLKIHHILLEGTIDEHLREIARDVRSGDAKARQGLNFTVGEVRQMFEIAG